MARNVIAQRIALTGGAEIEAELKKFGFAGEQVFKRLKADIESLNAPIRQLQANLANVGKSFQRFGTDMQRIGRTLSLAITAPIVGGFTLAVKAASDFESKMADIARVVDIDSPEGLIHLGEALRAMAVDLGASIGDLQGIAQAAGQAGIPFNELAGFTELVAKGAIALNLSFEETGQALAKIKTSLGLTTPAVGLLIDAVAKLADSGAASDAEIIGVVQEVASLGRQAGLSELEIAALGSTMISMGVDAESAGTAIRNMLLDLTSGASATAPFRAALKELGLDSVDVAKRMQTDGIGTIIDLFERLRKKAPEVRLALLQGLFDKRGAQALAPLIGNLKELGRQQAIVGDEANFVGRALDEFARRAETSAQKVREFKAALEELGITVGDELLPSFTALTVHVTELIKAFADSGPLVKWSVVIAGIAAAIGPVIFALGSTLRAIGALARGAAFLTGAFISLNATIASGGLLAALVALGSSLGAFLAVAGLAAGAIYLLVKAFSAGSDGADAHREAVAKMADVLKDVQAGVPGAADVMKSWGQANIEAAKAAIVNAEANLKLLKAQAALEAGLFNPFPDLKDPIQLTTIKLIKQEEQELRNLRFQIDSTNEQMAFGERAAARFAKGLADGVPDVNELGDAVDEVGAKVAKFPGPAANVRSLSDSPFAKAKKGAEELGQSADAEGKKVETAVDGMAAHIRTVPEEFRKVGAAATQAGTQTAAAAVTITTEVGKVGVEITRVQPQVEALTGAVTQVPVALAEAGTAATGALEPVNTAFATAAANTTQLSTAATTTFTGIEASAAQTAASLPALFTAAANAIAAAFAAAFAKVKAELSGLVSAVNAAISSMNAALARLRAAIAAAKAAAASAKAAVPGGGGGGGGFAGGGYVLGRGTTRSDSIDARLSNREFVHPADAVGYYGLSFMEMVRRKLLPRNILDILRQSLHGYRDGGLVVPRFNFGGLADAARQSLDGLRPQPMGALALAGIGGSTGALTPVHLHMPGGQTVIVQAEDSALAQMRRAMVDHRRGSTGKVY